MGVSVIGMVLVIVGGVGRYVAGTNYYDALVWTIVGNIGIVPIILILIKISKSLRNLNRLILTLTPALTLIFCVYH